MPGGRATIRLLTFRVAVLALVLLAQTAWSCRPSAKANVQGPTTSCPEVKLIRVSEEPEGDVLHDRAPETAELSIAPAGSETQASVTVIALGPALGSMDGRKVETTRACDANGVTITATTMRSAEYIGAVLKNILWRPRLEIVLAPRPTGTVLTTIWRMRLTTGAEVQRTRIPPYPEVAYPVTASTRIRAE
jgi:hypothetical protein